MAQNIVMAGFGPQVRHQYHPIFERLSARLPTRIKLLIDLKDQETTILNYLAERRNQPECILLLDPSQRVSDRMPPEVTEFLERIHRCDRIDKILVATEPKGHMGYILWALEHDVDVALEKPITSPLLNTCEPSSAGRILEDYLEIEKALNHSRSRAVVMINRRHHHGYNLIRNYLRRFLSEFGIPITYLEVYHSDGMWNMPDEFHYRENHPYKYGYGKLLHSGYHHVDLFMWLAQLNQ
jgi:predicted dehydrogenase